MCFWCVAITSCILWYYLLYLYLVFFEFVMYGYRYLGMNNMHTDISCLAYMVFDITYMSPFTLCAVFQCSQPCLYTSIQDYTSLSVYSMLCVINFQDHHWSSLDAIKGRVRIPSQAHFSMVVQKHWKSTADGSSLAKCVGRVVVSNKEVHPEQLKLGCRSATFRHTQSWSRALRSMDVVQYGATTACVCMVYVCISLIFWFGILRPCIVFQYRFIHHHFIL